MKYIFYLLSYCLIFACSGQTSSRTQTGGIVLNGKGVIGGSTDNFSLQRVNGAVPLAYSYDAFFKSVSNTKAAVGFTIREDSTRSVDGKLRAVHILLRNDSLIILKRSAYNTTPVKLFGKKNIFLPSFFKVVVNATKLELWTTRRSDGRYLSKVYEKDSVFTGWKRKTPNLIFPVYPYFVSTEITSIALNVITAGPIDSNIIVPPVPVYVASLPNVAKDIPYVTTLNYLPLNLIGTFTIPTYTNAQGYVRPKWAVWWNFWGQPFKDFPSIKSWQVGLMGNATLNPSFYAGSGIRGLDFIYPYDPNTGDPWADNIDPEVGQNFYDFVSTTPYYYRFRESSLDNGQTLESKGLTGSYDFGKSAISSAEMGFGDNVGGKTHRGMEAVDIEDGTADFGSQYHRAALIGMAENTTGDVSSDYGVPINTIGYVHEPATNEKIMMYYPNESGVYTDPSVNFSEDWRADTPLLSIPTKGVINKRPIDYLNIVPSGEVSFYAHEFAIQGSTYDLGAGNSIVINKYTIGRNTEHTLARAGTLLEWNAWYCRYKLNNRRFKMLTKVIADKGAIGLNQHVKLANGSFVADTKTEHIAMLAGREYAFDLVSLTYMNSVDLHEWDKNSFSSSQTHDTYVGFFSAIKMLMVNGADAYTDLVPQFWQTEQSYDGVTWVKHKAVDWADSPNILPCRTKVGNMKLEAMCWRPEGIEPTDVWIRATVGGVVRTIHITPDSWETTAPGISKPYSTANKDYFYTIKSY